MLYAQKNNLHASLQVDLLSVRSRELSYYYTNLRLIGASSALLSGFAFGIVASHSSNSMLSWIQDYTAQAGYSVIQPFVLITRFPLNSMQIIEVVLEILYMVCTIAAMGLTIFTLYICLLLSIGGPGLALRGPEGSVDKAIFGLAKGARMVIQAFTFALNLFIISVLIQSFLTFHLIASIVCATFLVYYLYVIQRHAKGLVKTFNIKPQEVVTGRFEVEAEVQQRLGHHDLFPTLSDLRGEVWQWMASRPRGLRTRLGLLPKPTEPQPQAYKNHHPSVISTSMIGVHQSPYFDLADLGIKEADGGLDGWFAAAFGPPASQDKGEGKGDRDACSSTQASDSASSSSSVLGAAPSRGGGSSARARRS